MGSFDRYCGKRGATTSCIKKGMHSHNKKTQRRAILARTLEHLPRRH